MQKIFEELYKGKCWGENVKKAMINETKVQLTEGWDNFNHVLYMKIQFSIFLTFIRFAHLSFSFFFSQFSQITFHSGSCQKIKLVFIHT